jgi:hypothetical protein
VWEPILATDTERAARKATTFLNDPRVSHYWVATRDVGRLFQEPIGLAGEPAWDVYLLYRTRTSWKDRPPRPPYFMHQLGGRLPDAGLLDAEVLATRAQEFLDKR